VDDVKAQILKLEAETRRAHDRIEAHEKLTAERLSGLREQVRTVRGEVLTAIDMVRNDMEQLRNDIRTLFHRFWVAAGTTLLVTVAALGGLFMYVMARIAN